MEIESNVLIESNQSHTNSKDRINKEFIEFLTKNTAYLCLNENSKVLVFNSELKIKDTIEALIQEEIYSGLIWNTESNQFISIFTLSDFLKILNLTYEKIIKLCLTGTIWHDTKHLATILFQKNNIQVEELDIIMENANSFNNSELEMNIEDGYSSNNNLKNQPNEHNIVHAIDMTQFHKKFHNYKDYFDIFNYMSLHDYLQDLESNIDFQKPITADLDSCLLDVIKLLVENHIHKIVIEDTSNNNFVGILTYESIFDYFMSNYYSDMTAFSISYKEYTSLVCRKLLYSIEDESIYSCFFKIWENKISVLPILNKHDNTKVIGFVFIKDLIFFLMTGDKYKFDDPIKVLLLEIYTGVNEELPLGQDRLLFIDESEEYSIKSLMEKIFTSPEKKIVITKNNNYDNIVGIITLSDFFKSIVDLTNISVNNSNICENVINSPLD